MSGRELVAEANIVILTFAFQLPSLIVGQGFVKPGALQDVDLFQFIA